MGKLILGVAASTAICAFLQNIPKLVLAGKNLCSKNTAEVRSEYVHKCLGHKDITALTGCMVQSEQAFCGRK